MIKTDNVRNFVRRTSLSQIYYGKSQLQKKKKKLENISLVAFSSLVAQKKRKNTRNKKRKKSGEGGKKIAGVECRPIFIQRTAGDHPSVVVPIRARTPAATRRSPNVRAGRRSGTHTQSANFLSVHRRGSVVRAAARHGAHTNVAN